MAGLRISRLKSLCSSVNPSKLHSANLFTKPARFGNQSLVRSSYALSNQDYERKEFTVGTYKANDRHKILSSKTYVVTQCLKASIFSTASMNSVLSSRSFSSSSGVNKVDKAQDVSAASSTGNVGNSGDAGIDWTDRVRDAWQNALDVMTPIGQKTKEAFDELIPYGQQLLDSHPYLKDVIVPVGYTFAGTILAWLVMPKLLRLCHKYAAQTPAAMISKSLSGEPVPYENSFWGALEDPVRYLVTFMAFLKIAAITAPTTIASQYLEQGWRGAVVVSFVWFLYRWKTNVFSRALGAQSLSFIDKERMLTLDRISSIGLFVIALMASAEACGVAVQSILTVGGIGGVATAFAARDVLGNVLSGLSLQFSKPFSLGDTIKAGSVEGQVIEMGLTNTVLLNPEKFPVSVPNSLFSSQVIVNKSRAQWRAMLTKIPVRIEDLDKIPQVSNDIENMLKSNPKVFLGKEPPYCFLSRIEGSFAELTIGCNLKPLSKYELFSEEQNIVLQSVKILQNHGGALGNKFTWQESS
ncbi:hypothetical protein JCGZ_14360 [Jatropha curcas]|uniref:Mechanosensitive ion channel MscS domain-containing protein n=1 Tax=Jatropha curcas TaxID=180498 RepID=A0A067K9U2_JATCU|nr:mechanosensitive ion channel protein 1, mitochondrial [Jatropha curcas]KDP28589.1 hypothetical protein JCGZ_14360 [Jatropha curcas]